MAFITLVSACNMNLEPYDSKSDDAALATASDLQIATYGTYAQMVVPDYVKMQHQLGEYPGDNVALSGNTGDPLRQIYNYQHIPNLGVTTNFWRQAYKVIFAANQIITRIESGESETLDQLKGENLYLRAMAHFDLVKYFGRPYIQDGGSYPGVPILSGPDGESLPARSTVKQVYDFVIADLKEAADLMTVNKPASFASREVAQGLLSRIYLYMGDDAKAIEYANLVINSGRYQLLSTGDYGNYFRLSPDANSETMYAIRHTLADNAERGSLGSMYYTDGTSGWGQMYASMDYMKLINKNLNDARQAFIQIDMDPNGVDTLKRGNVPKFYVLKYSYQEGHVNLSSPVYIRLAEMYLNRAEANARLGNDDLAIADVNLIRQRAGLSGAQLYTTDDLKGHDTVLDVVLEERRLELAFEAQRPLDLYRNNRSLVRAYIGFHSPDLFNQTILPTDARVIPYIPERETLLNPSLVQNP